jgi:hypothetical protein
MLRVSFRVILGIVLAVRPMVSTSISEVTLDRKFLARRSLDRLVSAIRHPKRSYAKQKGSGISVG